MIELDEDMMSRPRTPVELANETINFVDFLTRSTRNFFNKIT